MKISKFTIGSDLIIQNIISPILFIGVILSLLSGFSIIYALEQGNSPFEIANIYAMYAYISGFIILIYSIKIVGEDYYYKTINLVHCSRLKSYDYIILKMISILPIAIILSVFAYIEVFVYTSFVSNESLASGTFIDIIFSYITYALFYASFAFLIMFLTKNIFTAITFILAIKILVGGVLSSLLAKLNENLLDFVPFTYLDDSFSFLSFTPTQYIVTYVYIIIFILLSIYLYKYRARV